MDDFFLMKADAVMLSNTGTAVFALSYSFPFLSNIGTAILRYPIVQKALQAETPLVTE